MMKLLFGIPFVMLFPELYKLKVDEVTFVGFRRGDYPNRPPPGILK